MKTISVHSAPTMKRKRGKFSIKKSINAKKSPHLRSWNEALMYHGYLKKGEKKKIPKRGSAEHKKVHKTYEEMKMKRYYGGRKRHHRSMD